MSENNDTKPVDMQLKEEMSDLESLAKLFRKDASGDNVKTAQWDCVLGKIEKVNAMISKGNEEQHNEQETPKPADGVATNTKNKSTKKVPLTNAKRDARIYELKAQKKSLGEICNVINKEFNDPMDEKSISAALRRHCERHELQYPYGKPGRKSQ